MANRHKRRQQWRQTPHWEKMNQDQLMRCLSKNGITLRDLERNYNMGVHAGIDSAYQMCFAAVCLALNDMHGFGRVRCKKVLDKVQRYIVDSLTTADAVRDVYDRMGLTLDFGDPDCWVSLEDDD